MSITISEDEWLAAVDAACGVRPIPEGAHDAEFYSRRWGCSADAASKRLHRAFLRGDLQREARTEGGNTTYYYWPVEATNVPRGNGTPGVRPADMGPAGA